MYFKKLKLIAATFQTLHSYKAVSLVLLLYATTIYQIIWVGNDFIQQLYTIVCLEAQKVISLGDMFKNHASKYP